MEQVPPVESPTSPFTIQTDDTPGQVRLRGRKGLSPEEIEAYQSRRKGTPTWLWMALAVGAVAVIALLVVLSVTE